VATRARSVLLFNEGMPIQRIAACLFLRREVVRMWLERFIKDRLKGLYDLPRSGRPPVFSPGGGIADGENRLRIAG
jgi:transposase